MQSKDMFEFLQKTMDTLMLKHWGIVLINNNNPLFVKRIDKFKSNNSIFENSESSKATVIAVAVPYRLSFAHRAPDETYGKIESFAWEYDYHKEVKKILAKILEQLEMRFNSKFERTELCVDNSPYNDREVGYYAGFGSIGKNHLLIHPHLGTHFFIGYLVIKEHLLFDQLPEHQQLKPVVYEVCNSCENCVKACPTNVCGFEMLDMKNCLSALTQTKDWLNEVQRSAFNKQIYGCSICQEACPANKDNLDTFLLSGFTSNWINLVELLSMTSSEFKLKFGEMGFAWRSLWIYKRNALIVLSGTRSKQVLQQLSSLNNLERDHQLGEYYKWAINRLCISTADS